MKVPGSSIDLPIDTDLPADLGWAMTAPSIAAAFAQFSAAVGQSGERFISPAAREVVVDRIERWTGEDPGPSRHWVSEAVVTLDRQDQPSARLALLAALAAYQIDESVVHALRCEQSGDDALVGTLVWASFTAARRVGTWLSWPPPSIPRIITSIVGSSIDMQRVSHSTSQA